MIIRKRGQLVLDPASGERIAVWLIEYQNRGNAPADDVVLDDILTGHNLNELLLDIRSSPELTAQPQGVGLRFALGTLEPDARGRILLRTRLPAGATNLSNTATISSGDQRVSATAQLRIGLPAPVIVAPGSGLTRAASVQVRGLAVPGAQVRLRDVRGEFVGDPATADAQGRWSILAELRAGRNQLTAQAALDGRISPPSAPLNLFLDPTLIFDPISLRLSEVDNGVNQIQPDDSLGFTGLNGWYAHLRPNTDYQIRVRAACEIGTPTLNLQVGTLNPPFSDRGNGLFEASFNSGNLNSALAIGVQASCGATEQRASGLAVRVLQPQVVDAITGTPIPTATASLFRLTSDGLTQASFAERSEGVRNPVDANPNGQLDIHPQLRALQVQIAAEGYQPLSLSTGVEQRAAEQLRASNALTVTVPYQAEGKHILGDTEVYTHWREPLTATLRLLPRSLLGPRYRAQIEGSGLSEGSLSVPPGAVVEFINTELVERRLLIPAAPNETRAQQGVLDQQAVIDSGVIVPGASFSVPFTTAGTYVITDPGDGFQQLIVIVTPDAPPPDGQNRFFLPLLQR